MFKKSSKAQAKKFESLKEDQIVSSPQILICSPGRGQKQQNLIVTIYANKRSYDLLWCRLLLLARLGKATVSVPSQGMAQGKVSPRLPSRKFQYSDFLVKDFLAGQGSNGQEQTLYVVDHVSGDHFDSRRRNLRVIRRSQDPAATKGGHQKSTTKKSTTKKSTTTGTTTP